MTSRRSVMSIPERRRFLDRLVLAVDAEHASRVSALERSLRSRNRLLEEPRPDPHWLDAVEHETAEVAVAVAAARAETVDRLSSALVAARDSAPEFPHADELLQVLVRRREHPHLVGVSSGGARRALSRLRRRRPPVRVRREPR